MPRLLFSLALALLAAAPALAQAPAPPLAGEARQAVAAEPTRTSGRTS